MQEAERLRRSVREAVELAELEHVGNGAIGVPPPPASARRRSDEEAAALVTTIREVRRGDVAIVWIEHIVHVLIQVAERLICMDAGRVIADGAPDVVMKDAVVIDAYLGSTAPEAFA